MVDGVLRYIYDPLCGWCYAAAPLLAAARKAGVRISLHGGGLWAEPTRLEPVKATHIRESDARIAALTGQTFGDAYLDGFLGDPDATFWSQPTIAAILAAGSVRPGADLDMLDAIQEAHYVEGRAVIDAVVLDDLAVAIGLGVEAFGRAVSVDATMRHIEASRALMGRAGVRGFPGFLLETTGGATRLPHESLYGRPDDFVAAIGEARGRRAS